MRGRVFKALGLTVAFAVLFISVTGFACTKFNKAVVYSLAADKGFLDQAKLNHGECTLVAAPGATIPGAPVGFVPAQNAALNNRICRAIWKAIEIHERTRRSYMAYCAYTPGWEQGGQSCDPPADAAVRGLLQQEINRGLAEFRLVRVEYQQGGTQ